jgi:hypothetical protein
LRPRWLYRAAYIWAGLGLTWLVASGRLLRYFNAFRKPTVEPFTGPPTDMFVTAIVWLVSIGPLLLLAYDLGAQHTEARRLNTSIWRGFRETWRVAWQRPHLDEMAADFAERPEDDVAQAILQGLAMGVLPLVVFLSAMPDLRTIAGVVWIGGAGVFLGVTAYCRRRAAAYLRDDPGAWSMFRQWSLLNMERYEPDGRRFVYAQIASTVLLMIWWLGGAALVFIR